LGLVDTKIAFTRVQLDQIVHRVGAWERRVELRDRIVDAVLFRVDGAQAIVRLFVVGRDLENLFVGELRARDLPSSEVEVAEKAPWPNFARMRERIDIKPRDRAGHIARCNALAGHANRACWVGREAVEDPSGQLGTVVHLRLIRRAREQGRAGERTPKNQSDTKRRDAVVHPRPS